ncbi:MOSC domain [Popillia japonica]|uniref:MOSC domain n=1 Tax=Popillia japonica TaxID=7064 RepID=A0AAW1HUY5_POPJA
MPCTRCILSTVDPEAGILFTEREPLKTILRTNNLKRPEHIKCDGKKAVMGILIELWKGGEIHVGDECSPSFPTNFSNLDLDSALVIRSAT